MSIFKPLFKINIKHNYYPEGKTEDFKVIPTYETVQLLQNHGMLFRNIGSGFLVLAEVEETAPDVFALRQIPALSHHFQFMLIQQKPKFLNYTDLPFSGHRESIYYFSNLHSNQIDEDKLLYPDGAFVTEDEQMKLETGFYRFQKNETSTLLNAKLVFPDLGIEEERQVVNYNNQFEVEFDLSDFPSGRAELWIDDVLEDSFYSLNQRNKGKIFGLVDIFYSPEVPLNYRFTDEGGTLTYQEYKLSFKNRSTFWKYIVVNRSSINQEDLGVKHASYTFSQDMATSYPDNYVILTSNQVIPLTKERNDTFALQKNVNSSGRDLLSPLPNPGIEALTRDMEDLQKFYSEIFVII